MKKVNILLSFFLLTLIFLSGTNVLAADANQNLILNGGFESVGQNQQPDNWNAEFWKPDSTLRITSTKVHQGKYALEINSEKVSNDARMLQTIKVKPNTFYKLSGWAATFNVTPEKIGANLCVKTNSFTNSPSLTKTVDWTFLELNFRTASQQTEVTVGPRLGMWGNDVTGVAYFDDLSLVELDTTPSNYITLENMPAEENSLAKPIDTTTEKSSFPVYKLILIIISLLIILLIVFVIYKAKQKRAVTEEEEKDDEVEVRED